MFQSLNNWVFSQNDRRNLVEPIHLANGEDFNLDAHEYEKMNRRIQQYLLDDNFKTSHDVDNTLKLMRDETQRWEGSNNYVHNGEHERFSVDPFSFDVEHRRMDEAKNDATDDQLLGYCLRLERNNEYLIDLVKRFEEVSFQKRYEELAKANEAMTKEINRLKSINTKVYSSYCDLVDELKIIRNKRLEADKLSGHLINENENLKTNTRKLEKEIESNAKSDSTTIERKISSLKRENLRKDERIVELRKKTQTLEKNLNDKDTELTQCKSKNLALSLKLEKLEALFLKRERNSHKNANSAENTNTNSKSFVQFLPNKIVEKPSKPSLSSSFFGDELKCNREIANNSNNNNNNNNTTTTNAIKDDNTTELLARFSKNVSLPQSNMRKASPMELTSGIDLAIDDTMLLLKKEWPTKEV